MIAALLVAHGFATAALVAVDSSAATPAAHDGDDGSNFNFDFSAATCAVFNSTAAAPAAIASTALAFCAPAMNAATSAAHYVSTVAFRSRLSAAACGSTMTWLQLLRALQSTLCMTDYSPGCN